MRMTARVEARVRREFRPEEADEALRELATAYGSSSEGAERIQAAVVLGARGNLSRLKRAVRETHLDFRDVLMGADKALAGRDWREVLAREFPDSGPVPGRRTRR